MDWPPPDMDFNNKKFEKYHHVIQYAPNGEDRVVKICRCWQSKRFPYCDDTHKVIIEAGDNVGPYVLKINGKAQVQNVGSNMLENVKRSQLPRSAMFFTVGFLGMGLAAVAASTWARGRRLNVEVDVGKGGESAPASAQPTGLE